MTVFGAPRAFNAARRLLKAAGATGAPVDPYDLATRVLGAQVREAPFHESEDQLAGALLRHEKIIGLNARAPLPRRRFALAHEIGHFVLNHFLDEGLHLDARLTMKEDGPACVEANLFAVELLIPLAETMLAGGADLEDEEQMAGLAEHYGVSAQVLSFRLGLWAVQRL